MHRPLPQDRLCQTPRPSLTFDGTGLALEFRYAPTYLKVTATPPVTEQVGRLESQLESQLKSQLESNLKARVVLLLRVSALGKKELSLALRQKAVSGPLHQAIRDLGTDGWIESTLPDKPNSRLQKYRLTAKAHEWLASRSNS